MTDGFVKNAFGSFVLSGIQVFFLQFLKKGCVGQTKKCCKTLENGPAFFNVGPFLRTFQSFTVVYLQFAPFGKMTSKMASQKYTCVQPIYSMNCLAVY